MAKNRTLIQNAVVISVDDEIGELPNADILIEDDVIAAVGVNLKAGTAYVIDASNMVAIPGFVDTHRHTWQSVIRGIATDWTLGEYFQRIRAGIPPAYRPRDVYAANLIGALEALDSGITTMLDWSHIQNSPDHSDAAIEALRHSGMRAVFAHGTPSDPPSEWYADSVLPHPEDIHRIRRDQFPSNDGLVTLAMAIRGADFATMDIVRQDVQTARDLGLRMTMHIGGGLNGAKKRSIARMHEAGLLGPDMTFVHCNCCGDDELHLIAETGGTASVAANIEMQMGHGMPATGRLLNAGVRPSLSIDIVTGVSGNMFDEMRVNLQVERAIRNRAAMDEGIQPASLDLYTSDVLAFATIDGARTVGLEDKVGSITPGKQADIVLLRYDTLNLSPLNKPTGQVVTQANTGNVDTILVAGNIVKQGGELVDVDLEHVRQLAIESRDHIFRTAGIPDGATPVGFVE